MFVTSAKLVNDLGDSNELGITISHIQLLILVTLDNILTQLAEVGDLSYMTWLESESSQKFEDLRPAWLTLIEDSTWLWLSLHDLRLDLRQMNCKDFTFLVKYLQFPSYY